MKKECELFFNKIYKEFITKKRCSYEIVKQPNGKNYLRTCKTPFPIGEISSKLANFTCKNLDNLFKNF